MSDEAYPVEIEINKDGSRTETVSPEYTFSFYIDEDLADAICECAGIDYNENVPYVEICIEDAQDIVETFDFHTTSENAEQAFKKLVKRYTELGYNYIQWRCY